MTTNIILISYGLFLIIGGLMGLKKGSKISLIMGAGSGVLVFAGLWYMTIAPKPAWIFLTCLNGILSLAFISRFLKTKAFMPSGLLLIITLAVLIFCVTKIIPHA